MSLSTSFILMASLLVSVTPFCSNPITLSMWMWITSLFITFNISLLLSAWFAYLTFMIYLGGLLVMFAYFVALDPNQKFLSLKPPLMMLMFSLLLITPYMTLSPMLPTSPSLLANYSTLHLFFLSPSILAFFATVLFITMVIVAKIATPKFGPLRPFL